VRVHVRHRFREKAASTTGSRCASLKCCGSWLRSPT